ncbi:PD-(D/E)XK nuclease family protein [Salinicoccus luteus]|uniref:PD-(D/E)XK nuclease family protein n=1 Tax=Salinicoccus luteus TaxID=367840 RepID=UPI0004E1B28C|nr:PD-(D/E)XK nuclease family protein [Salinicoccus luteus]
MSIESFNFDEMTLKLANIPESTVKKKLDTTARIFGIEHKENYISNWLAFLIDPERFGSEEPLNALLSLYFSKLKPGGEEYEEDYAVSENELVEVSREEALGQAQRIDFLITTDKLLIGIESKIYAVLHKNQLGKYGKSIIGSAKKGEEKKIPVLILLTPKGSKESPSDDFISITFEELAEAFRKLHFDYLNNLRSAFLLEDFVNYVEEYLKGGESSMNEEWARFISSNQSDLKTTFQEGRANLKLLMQEVDRRMQETLEPENWEVRGNKKEDQFWRQLKNEEWNRFNVHYEVGVLEGHSTHGFILPDKLRLTLDIEDKQLLKYWKKSENLIFDELEEQNEIDVFYMNYSSKITISKSLEEIMKTLRDWDIKNREKVNSTLQDYEKNKS